MNKPKKTKTKPISMQTILLFVSMLIAAGLFLSVAFVLIIGMLPTLVALMVDKKNGFIKAATVGSLNLAGCFPFIIELLQQGRSMEQALDIITSPSSIVVMYSAAAIGYLIDWAVTGMMSNLFYEQGQHRSHKIKERQSELIKRWGSKVKGDEPLDEKGFPIAKQ